MKELLKEEAIAILIREKDEDPFIRTEYREKVHEALNMAIKALEQESFMNKPCVAHQVCHEDKVKVLDKVRDEIAEIAINGQVDEHTAFIRTGEQVKQVALDIIDKYKAESENK